MTTFTIDARATPRALKAPIEIATYRWESIPCLTASVARNGCSGHGEGTALFYRPETAEGLAAQITALAPHLTPSVSRQDLLGLLPANGARAALDAALWHLQTAESRTPAWRRAGLVSIQPILTVATVYLDTPGAMAETARDHAASYPLLKIKLGAEGDDERLRAIRAAAPSARLVVDANAGWTEDAFASLIPILTETKVELVEQPLAPTDDGALNNIDVPIKLAADESFQTAEDIAHCVGKYDVLNVKLDKCGGLTSALAIADIAERLGFELMVGNMLGSSLGMAPAHLFAQRCLFADLDGPLSLAKDVRPPLFFDKGYVSVPDPELWG
ncbi:MAG: dipeptide epimerase [Pseudomonadota bacterium]